MLNMIWNSMFNKIAGTVLLFIGYCMITGFEAGAKVDALERQTGDRSILVIYSTADGEINGPARILDLALGHFASKIVFQSDELVSDVDLAGMTHLVYYGQLPKELPKNSKQIINNYSGPVLAIGENIEQLYGRFALDTALQKSWINKVSKPESDIYELLDQNYSVTEVTFGQGEGETIIQGFKGDHPVSLMVMQGNNAYFATPYLHAPFNHLLEEGLHSFFRDQHVGGHLAYIRLEDVHPYSDPALVKAAGEFLAERHIPFMIALIPVYTNPETQQQIHLRDMPELVAVLKDLQERGASIIMHGYTHQFRSSETGEGFEFWDVENNMPISGHPDEKIVKKQRYDFASKTEYDKYRNELNRFDHVYTRTRIESGVRELTELGLYPFGFEPPHYTMSQEGYRTVSEYFSYLVGRVQLSDHDWRQMGAASYVSKPAFLHGMILLPETVGYYDPNSLTPLEDVKKKINEMQFVRDGMMGMFYHPYLGVENLKEMVALMDFVPDLQWVDLKNMAHPVKEKFVTVDCSDKPCTDVASPKHQGGAKMFQMIVWLITGLALLAVIAFILYTIHIRMGLRKQLFEERSLGG